jgi:hypothetical protein
LTEHEHVLFEVRVLRHLSDQYFALSCSALRVTLYSEPKRKVSADDKHLFGVVIIHIPVLHVTKKFAIPLLRPVAKSQV